ncbi:TGF-beta-activated kinase 1 and MAP3K7-binding protein 3 isoform X3 [Falco biarmicus]|uniref:TGF-beta-activated kinase 1 and MAP3K7-binding protein 3 isoform X3 n=1 Tax=Falco rusticolus TaxID=120794 RepID=UPI000FFC5846|nr:TGF-beta-activated kinase 1 and MAP3K7-binding protein 3 isoform X3 [Falco rusticolus]XP_040438418.1 TGF-beta-activated kinase 1 and MAP3K7-binding protein 3 isoform X3 [Falco naumanni]XP_055557989.1 TGF-beta-activated kinase 1 and MAP3K7-binding protein 3 isoform X3 [Falco cherrug]XP_055658058.1 TGF-beta-activated kinase 1 and MAP3K7-binding protein 3 isoform X3 [Falco peregrinus]XP_056184118.1 TGF-beta-activated kinase 1 and MAP3K7-binding protein 3 isoform X3 [Falco biarmicus]
MAQGSQQLDMQVLHDLRQRFPEIPEGVVSQCMLQNNNNLDACCRALAQESNKYLYMEYHSPDDTRMNRNSLLHINLGIHPHTSYHVGDGAQLNGGRTLVHSSSDGHIDPQRTAGKQLICLVQEPHSAPAVVAASPSYNPFFVNDQNRNAATPPPQPPPQPSSIQPGMNTSAMQGPPPTYMHIPRYSTNPITVTVSQNLPSGQSVPRALQILPQIPSNLYGTPGSIYIRQTSQSSSGRQTPQNTQWHSSPQGPVPHYTPRPLPVYPHQQNYQPSQYSPKQAQIPQSAFRSPPASQCPSPFGSPQHQVQTPQLGHQSSHVFMPPSPSTVPPHPYQQASQTFQKQGGHSVPYLPPFAGPSLSKGSMNKIEITVEPPQRPGTAMNRSPSPISNQPSQRNQHSLYAATTPPSSSPSRALLLHQRARMERLAKELKLEKEELERLKAEVNGMEHDLMQRRLRRVSCTTAIPTPEEMTRLRSLNRQLQINVDCTLKEVDLLQSRGNFDPKAACNFYDNIEPGPVVPPKPYKKEHQNSSKQTPRTQPRDEDFEGAPWNCDSCTFLNHPALNRCEQCEMPRYT